MNEFAEKCRDSVLSVMPITAIVLLLHFTVSPLETPELLRFLLGAVFIMLGLAVFLLGVDVGIGPIAKLMGNLLTRSNKVLFVAAGGLLLGFFITVAEPDLQALANQVDFVTSGAISKIGIVLIVSVGIAVMLSLGLLRIMYNIPLYKLLTGVYLVIFALSLFTSSEFLAISFDASGATTGALTVPFILTLAMGVSSMKKDSKASEKDSFGLVAIASTGAIVSVMVMSILSDMDKISATLENSVSQSGDVFGPFLNKLPTVAFEVLLALSPLVILFAVFQKVSFRLPVKSFAKILKGLLYSFAGLTLFLAGVISGFTDVGILVGHSIASTGNGVLLICVAFALGLVTILAEPAVYVLTHQIETVTSGSVKKRVVLGALALGVGTAVALSVVRILVPQLQLWHYLLPGYAIAIAMTYFAPKLFVGIAFDSGGVASGPMTATFILAFAQGAAQAVEEADILIDGFGIISMVALTPLITLQLLGLIYRIKSRKEGV